MTRTRRATGEALLVPPGKRRSQVRPITSVPGKWAEGERVEDGLLFVVRVYNPKVDAATKTVRISRTVKIKPKNGPSMDVPQPVDEPVVRMGSESLGRNESERTGGLERWKLQRPSPLP